MGRAVAALEAWLASASTKKGFAITGERIRQILTAAAEAAGMNKKLSPHWLRHSHGSHAHQRGAPAATIRDTLGHTSLSTTDLYLSSAPTDGSSLYLHF